MCSNINLHICVSVSFFKTIRNQLIIFRWEIKLCAFYDWQIIYICFFSYINSITLMCPKRHRVSINKKYPVTIIFSGNYWTKCIIIYISILKHPLNISKSFNF